MSKESLKPMFYSIAQAKGDCSVIYTCGMSGCDRVFRIVDKDFNYCPKCGTKIDWGVVTVVDEEFKNLYNKSNIPEQNLIADYINNINTTITDGQPKRFI